MPARWVGGCRHICQVGAGTRVLLLPVGASLLSGCSVWRIPGCGEGCCRRLWKIWRRSSRNPRNSQRRQSAVGRSTRRTSLTQKWIQSRLRNLSIRRIGEQHICIEDTDIQHTNYLCVIVRHHSRNLELGKKIEQSRC